LREHLQDSELLRQQFARVAQTGLMVLRNPAGRKRKVGGKDWAQRRLFEQVRGRMPDFVLLRQAERETITLPCDLDQALGFLEQLTSMQIRVRRLPLPSPFGESLLRVGFPAAPVALEPAEVS
jgi:Lhr-like helicase